MGSEPMALNLGKHHQWSWRDSNSRIRLAKAESSR